MDICFVGHENLNTNKHPELFETITQGKSLYNLDKISSKCEALNEVTLFRQKFTKNLVFGYLNVNCLRNKFQTLEFLIKDKFGVFLISESKLYSSFSEAKFKIPGYRIFRQD